MATFTITTTTNINTLTSKTGVDTYNINEGHLIIDSDTRYGANQFTSAVLGNITISPTLGGKLTIRCSNVKLVPFNNGSGVVPNSGTIITQGSVTSELLCVMKSRWGDVVFNASSPMPVSGYLKVRNISGGSYSSGSFSGINASAISSEENGWITVVGTNDRTFNIPRMGEMRVEGEWFYLENTTGVRGQTIQLPHITATSETHYPLIEIETYPGSNVFEAFKNVGSKFTSSLQSLDSRCKNVHISTSGLVTIGLGTDSSAAGFLPVSGCRVRIPGIILQNAAQASLTVNSTPTNTLGNRFESAFTSAGTLYHNISTGVWYWNIIQPFRVEVYNLHTSDQFALAEAAMPPIIDRLFVGLTTIANQYLGSCIQLTQCYNGGTVGLIDGVRSEGNNGSAYSINLLNLFGGWTFQEIRAFYSMTPTVVSGCVCFSGCDNLRVEKLYGVGKRVLFFSSSNIKINQLYKADTVSGNTVTTVSSRAVEFSSNTVDIEIYDLKEWPDAPNTHPYDSLFAAQSCKRIKIRNIGSVLSPYNCGTANSTGYLFSDIGNNEEIWIQRCWLTNLRSNIYLSNNSTSRCRVENCYNSDATKNHAPQFHNSLVRGNRQNNNTVLYGYTSVYGTHFWDSFISDVATRLAIIFVEATTSTSGYYQVVNGTPVFTAQGELAMATAGDQVIWTMPYFMLGWTGLTTWGVGGTNQTTNHSYEYDIDRGSGFTGTFKSLTNSNLTSETAISSSGVRLKIKITCTVSSNTNRVRSFFIDGTTTLLIQNAALYPLDMVKLKLTNLQPGSSIAVFETSVSNGEEYIYFINGLTTDLTIEYPYNASITNYTLRIRKPGFAPIELVYTNTLQITIPVFQIKNTDGFGADIYGRGNSTSDPFLSIEPNNLRIDIANFRCIAEDVYDWVANWQASPTGIKYPEALRFDGVDLLLLNDWRFRRKDPIHLDAGLDALPVVDGQPNGSPDDEANGSVDFRARSVRTWSDQNSQITPNDLAAAVWGFSQSNGLSAQTNLLKAQQSAQNAFVAAISK